MGVGEFVGWRALAGEDTDGALYTMGLTEEPVVRCRDCRWYTPEFEYEEERGFGCHEVFPTLVGMIPCPRRRSDLDHRVPHARGDDPGRSVK